MNEHGSSTKAAAAATGETPEEEREPDERVRSDDSDDRLEPLLGTDEAAGLRERWQSIQVGFVDEPRQAVEEADSLVTELMQRLAQTFHQERENLEGQWS